MRCSFPVPTAKKQNLKSQFFSAQFRLENKFMIGKSQENRSMLQYASDLSNENSNSFVICYFKQ